MREYKLLFSPDLPVGIIMITIKHHCLNKSFFFGRHLLLECKINKDKSPISYKNERKRSLKYYNIKMQLFVHNLQVIILL